MSRRTKGDLTAAQNKKEGQRPLSVVSLSRTKGTRSTYSILRRSNHHLESLFVSVTELFRAQRLSESCTKNERHEHFWHNELS